MLERRWRLYATWSMSWSIWAFIWIKVKIPIAMLETWIVNQFEMKYRPGTITADVMTANRTRYITTRAITMLTAWIEMCTKSRYQVYWI